MTAYNLDRLRRFVGDVAALVGRSPAEADVLREGQTLLQDMIRHDDWLPAEFSQADPTRYRQYLLHCDSAERFSIVSFVWGPGQTTPIHNHTVWGLVGVLRGAEISQRFTRNTDGSLRAGDRQVVETGQVEALSSAADDIHQVSNAHADRVSVSIHVYGGNIGAVSRSTFDLDGQAKTFISGYSNTQLPNLWDAQANEAAQ